MRIPEAMSVPSPTFRNALHSSSLSGAYNSGYEATAFGFRPNPRYVRTSHIPGTLGAMHFERNKNMERENA